MKFEVIVQLKKEVLDPEGRAIKQTLERVGVEDIRSIKVGKRYLIEIDDSCKDKAKKAEEIARSYLANPVAETFEVKGI